MSQVMSRRNALLAATATAVSPWLGSATQAAGRELTDQPICVFTKPFHSLSFDELAERIAELGCDGIEAPIRPKGHIEPANVEEQLPKLVDALRRRDLEITIMASDINDARDPLTEKVLRTAASLGIQRYRMKYLKYDPKRSVPEQLNDWRVQLRDLAALNFELGIRAVYQNHASNKMLGAALWDLQQVLDGIPVEHIGVAYDIRHATVEGGMSWPITFRMIRPHIDTVYVKDFQWTEKGAKNVALGEGRIDPSFFRMLAESEFRGPISLHEEYLDHRQPDLIPQHLVAIKKDLKTLHEWLAQSRSAE